MSSPLSLFTMSNSTIPAYRATNFTREVEPIDPDVVPDWVYQQNVNQYFQIAVVTLLVYDASITIDKEAKYFWRIPRKPVDIAYFLNRYVGIFGQIAYLFWNSYNATQTLCNFAAWAPSFSFWITIVAIDYILMIRVLALYSQSRLLSICLFTLLVLEAGVKLGVLIYLNDMEHVVVGGLANDVTVCGTIEIPPWSWGIVDGLVPMAYGVILMLMALYKAAEYWKLSAGFKGFTLVKVLIQDQVLYFMLLILCFMFSALGFILWVPNAFASDLLTTLGNPGLLCILGSRIMFNLKEAGERGQNEGTNYMVQSTTLSEMDFALPENGQKLNTVEGIRRQA